MCNVPQRVNRFQDNYVTELNVLNKTLKYSSLYLGLCSFGFLHCVGRLLFTDLWDCLLVSALKALDCLTLEDWTDRLSLNVSKQVPTNTA